MAKINVLVLFSLLFGLINCYGGSPQLSRRLNVRPTLRQETTVLQQQQPLIETIPQTETPTFPTSGYASQQSISRESLRKPSGYGLTPTLVRRVEVMTPPPTTTTTTTTTPAPLPVPSYGSMQHITRERPAFRKEMLQTPTGYSFKPAREQVTVDPCTPNPCYNSGVCRRITDTTFTCECTQYFFGDYCEYQREFTQERTSSQVITPSTIEVAVETQELTSCSQNPCLNEATCVPQGSSFVCQCPWGWTGKFCEICITECASNPCGSLKKCRAFYGGGYECICPPDRTGPNCEIQNDVCSLNPCLNGGICKASTEGQYECTCQMPFAGVNCESEWQNPCTAEVLRSTEVIQFENPWDRKKYIICTDIEQWVTMSCSEGTLFNTKLGYCAPEGFEAPMCPPGYCLNDGECIVGELSGQLECKCKPGFSGASCEINIDECALYGNPCGSGQCIDQINTYYCYCPDGGIGLDCQHTIQNPCTPQNIDMDMTFFTILSRDGDHYLRCSDVDMWTVHRCAEGLYWSQQEKTCTIEKPADLTGKCATGPCKNGGECVDLGASFKCVCKEGYAGELCEQMIDYCASNPCMNGGRCLPYAGGYTCVCPDKIIDDCCCNGVINPCPAKDKLIPGVNNYYPHIFPYKYIHCDFDGRAFVRNCAHGTLWKQEVLSCLPQDFVLNTTAAIAQAGLPTETTSYGQLPKLTRKLEVQSQRVKMIPKTESSYGQLPVLTHPVRTQPLTTTTTTTRTPVQPSYFSLPKIQALPKKTVTIVKTEATPVESYNRLPELTRTVPRPIETQTTYNTLPQLTQPVARPVETQSTYNTLPQLTQPVARPVLPTRTRVQETPSSYNTLPTIERPVERRIMETPAGYGSSLPTTTETPLTENTFYEDYSNFEQPEQLTDSFASVGVGRTLVQESQPIQTPILESRTMNFPTPQRTLNLPTPQRTMMMTGRTLQQPVNRNY